jgi:hypothetical protein
MIFFLLVFVLFNWIQSDARQLNLKGQLSGWFLKIDRSSEGSLLGIRYIPELAGQISAGQHKFDFELSANAYYSGNFKSANDSNFDGKIKPYRGWGRYSTAQFEARVGLQKINFGSAFLLRPLMWFDRIDPRDPLQITDGVNGLLFRYYFLNNANIWLWGLYGNDETKGWEYFKTNDKSIEYGGRIQYPIYTGELALTYHHRNFDFQINPPFPFIKFDPVPEERFGIDGKWDWEVGLWFESVVQYQKADFIPVNYQHFTTIGLDYTFGIGNGLHVLTEYFNLSVSEKLLGTGEKIKLAAILMDYPLGMFDKINFFCYYNQNDKEFYNFVNWQRTLDNWLFHLMAFWNPATIIFQKLPTSTSFFSGKGIQLMVVFNH